MMQAPGERHIWVWYTPFGQGGVETYLYNMARETRLDGHEVWVAATTDAAGPLRQSFASAGIQLLDWSGFHDAFMSGHASHALQAQLTSDLARIRPTLLALNDCNDFSMGAAPLLRQLRSHCTILDTLHIDSPVDQYLEFRRSFLDVLDGIAATNQHVAQRFCSHYPEAAGLQVRYIANGTPSNEQARAAPGPKLRLLYAGRLAQDQKRVLDLPPLLEQLRRRGKAFTMTIVGDGPCRDALAAELQARGLSDCVTLAGYLPPEQLAPLYLSHDALVNLSTFEGFSMSVLEAFAAGCVPVCTNVASLDDSVFLDGVNCRLCDVGRLDAMVDIWCELTPQSLASMSLAARETGRRFSSSNTYLAYRELVESLRRHRPLQPWSSDGAHPLCADWDLSRHNPWLARPGRLKGAARRMWTRITRAADGALPPARK